MISKASLLVAALVFNAATVLCAPIRMDIPEPVAPSVIHSPVQPVARAVTVEAREPAVVPVTEKRRQYPRRVYYEFYEKREPTPAPVPALQQREPVVEERERRFPRRSLYDLYKRDPATSVNENLTWKKVTVFDTPADAAAFHASEADDAGAGSEFAPSMSVATSAPSNIPDGTVIVTFSTVISSATSTPVAGANAAAANPAATGASPIATDPATPAADVPTTGASNNAGTVSPAQPPVASGGASAPAANGVAVIGSPATASFVSVVPAAATSTNAPSATVPAAAITASPAPSDGPANPSASDAPAAPDASDVPTSTANRNAPSATEGAPESDAGTHRGTGAAVPSSTCSPSSSNSVSCRVPSGTATDTPDASSTSSAADRSAPAPDATASGTPDASTLSPDASGPPADPSSTDVPAPAQRQSEQPAARRALAASGATWASAVRRQLNG